MSGEPAVYKPRTFMISDILNEPDDEMSLVRFLLYSTTLMSGGSVPAPRSACRMKTHPEVMERIIRAYGKVVDNLNSHVSPNCQFPPADQLLAIVSSSPKVYGRKFLSEPLSEGARRLIQSLEESEEPLYVGLWGGANVVAQAMHHIDQTKPKAEADLLRIRQRWPNIVYIVSIHGFGEFLAATWVGINAEDNGIPDMTQVQDGWLTPDIRVGPLGAEYPLIKFGMEGDSPSFMGLIPNGLSNPERPGWGGWGDRYNRITWAHDLSAEYGVSPDTVVTPNGKPHMSVQSTVWRWRDASQDDFAARMQWSLHQDFSAAAHPPLIDVNGSVGPEALHIVVPPKASITLDASKTVDLDHPGDIEQLEFEWFFYLEPGFPQATGDKKMADYINLKSLSPPTGTDGRLPRNEAGFGKVILGPRVSVMNLVPEERDLRSREWHIILQGKTKKGPYPITRYKRVVLKSE
ncbi:Hypothetical protein NCS54_00869600 [Fusarium falciforme]|uniref:Hypothetical protein n=1 Tax=Fusarium falciforme TaxID=195108 RepID=UPI00230069BC|nr:Hypothetical protein NCS54_00869600 [Fusarium falciforme]WAO91236.1 Hypothetical protein NCS54_00869600 [Fusarium falciforme]